MKKYIIFLLMIVLCIACEGQIKPSSEEEGRGVVTQNDSIPRGPASITRMIQQGKNGEMWITAFDGVFQYDGMAITKVEE